MKTVGELNKGYHDIAKAFPKVFNSEDANSQWGRFISQQIPEKLSKEIKRQFPRHSIEGHERCEQAIKDLFIHIPPCGEGRSKRKRQRLDLKKFLLNPKAFPRHKDLIS